MSLIELILKQRTPLEKKDFIHAFWIEGSYATGLFQDNSDIDVWLDVDKDKFSEAETLFYDTLTAIHPVRGKKAQHVYSSSPWLAKSTYYLLNESDERSVELDMQAHGRDITLSRSKDKIVSIFDESSVIRWDEA